MTRVGILFGGRSGEHDVSIVSARALYQTLTQGRYADRYQAIPIYIDRQGQWWDTEHSQDILAERNGAYELDEEGDNEGFWEFPPEVQDVDVWFPVTHGPNGEDGVLQGLLTLSQTPFVGSGVLGSAVGMDKIAMKMIFAAAGLPQVNYMAIRRDQVWSDPCVFSKLCDQIAETLGYPCFVKPANLGSSVGIAKVRNHDELAKALDAAAGYDRRIIVEAGVVARELECGVLGYDPLRASMVGEITFDADFYDYETKYTDGRSAMVIPAAIPQDVSEKIKELAIAACQALDATGLSRVDFFYEEKTGNLFLNEINTLPGFTALSMYPQLWAATGIPFDQLVHELIQGAIARHAAT